MIWNETKDRMVLLDAITYLSIETVADRDGKKTYSIRASLSSGVDFVIARGIETPNKAKEGAEALIEGARDRRLRREIGITDRYKRK